MDRLDIGHGVSIAFVRYDGVVAGIQWHHRRAGEASTSEPCNGGFVAFAGRSCDHGYSWTVVQEEPLTLLPSLLCRACGCHGFIRGGRWVPC